MIFTEKSSQKKCSQPVSNPLSKGVEASFGPDLQGEATRWKRDAYYEFRELGILAELVDGGNYADYVYEHHPELWTRPRRIRGKYKIPKPYLTCLRIYKAIEKLVETANGARTYAWVERIRDITGFAERTIRRYLSFIMKLVSRDYVVNYTKGKGYLISCPYWESQKAAHGDLFDPPKKERIKRSPFLKKETREFIEELEKEAAPPCRNLPPDPIGFHRVKKDQSTNAGGRPKGRLRPAPPPLQKLARRILAMKPLGHYPRVPDCDHLGHSGAVHLLKEGYHRDDVGKAVRKALRTLDTAVSDGLPDDKGKYFWGILKSLKPEIRRWNPKALLESRREFWSEQKTEATAMKAAMDDDPFFPPGAGKAAIDYCELKLEDIEKNLGASAPRKTA